ncbi:unnamed protein product [Lupinus luteus]|uniref:Uncharacterized protein n=1 Tax=Lupinus luteus TaxID=3873 RepID=A0AAV1VXH8_LUPLU
MSWRAPSRASDDRARSLKEKELGHAMELSPGEDLKRPNAHQGYDWGIDNDEDYSKGLEDSLDSSAYPQYAPAPYYPRDYRSNLSLLFGFSLLYEPCAQVFVVVYSLELKAKATSLISFWATISHNPGRTNKPPNMAGLEKSLQHYYEFGDHIHFPEHDDWMYLLE